MTDDILDVVGDFDKLGKSVGKDEKELQKRVAKRKVRNRAIVSCISVMMVWLVATVVFFVLDAATSISPTTLSLCFIYAVPTSMVVWLVFNSIWFNKRRNFLIISLLMWTSLAALFVTLIGFQLWLMFIVGIPAQIIIWLWSGIRTRNPRK